MVGLEFLFSVPGLYHHLCEFRATSKLRCRVTNGMPNTYSKAGNCSCQSLSSRRDWKHYTLETFISNSIILPVFHKLLLLAGCLMSVQHASVPLRRICLDNCICCCTVTESAIKLAISPSHSIPTTGQPVPMLALQYKAPDRVASGIPIVKSLAWFILGKPSHGK